MSLSDFKSQFSNTAGWIHFNNSGQAPIPQQTKNIMSSWLDRLRAEGAHCSQQGWSQTESTRQKLAHFIGATPEELAFFPTTAAALSQAAFSVPLGPNDEIITWDQEYPSNFYPWRVRAEKAGAKLVQLASVNWNTPFEKVIEAVNERTRVIAISWVQYQTGAICDLKKISEFLRGRDIWLIADVIQGVGVYPFNFKDCGFDIICGGSHKWLCSSYGAAFMAIRQERLPQLEPIAVGAMTYGTPDTQKSFSISTRADAKKFEPGSKAMLEIIGLGATLDLLNTTGISIIHNEACRLADLLRQGLLKQGYRLNCQRGPIVNFTASDKVMNEMQNAKISFAPRGPGIRISLHAFNQDSEVEKLLQITAGNSN
jgi:cysteine desulfurase/selenocysteine lyase